MQLRRRSASRKSGEKEKVRSDRSSKKGNEPFQGQKEIVVTPSPSAPKTSSIKCFKCLRKGHIASQCPNRRTIIIRVSLSLNDDSHLKGDLLMIRRLIGSQMVDEAET
ncbi:hypothetical protein CR513_02304, partial [Mucuna pruriens]